MLFKDQDLIFIFVFDTPSREDKNEINSLFAFCFSLSDLILILIIFSHKTHTISFSLLFARIFTLKYEIQESTFM